MISRRAFLTAVAVLAAGATVPARVRILPRGEELLERVRTAGRYSVSRLRVSLGGPSSVTAWVTVLRNGEPIAAVRVPAGTRSAVLEGAALGSLEAGDRIALDLVAPGAVDVAVSLLGEDHVRVWTRQGRVEGPVRSGEVDG